MLYINTHTHTHTHLYRNTAYEYRCRVYSMLIDIHYRHILYFLLNKKQQAEQHFGRVLPPFTYHPVPPRRDSPAGSRGRPPGGRKDHGPAFRESRACGGLTLGLVRSCRSSSWSRAGAEEREVRTRTWRQG